MPLASGSKLGPYEVQSPLGAGGMGEVYRARDTRLDRTVAIKILPEHLAGSAEARQRFDREARAISSLNHPHICHLYDVGQQDSTSYLVMEFLDGETLAERLRKGPLPLDQVLRIGSEICEGLEKAHRTGVVHRDLKPGNIMLTKTGAKLMDFGLAKAPSGLTSLSSSNSLATMSQPLTAEGTIMGTMQYMSPEQLEGREADARSDIFSLGAVLYEMLAGKRAFEGKTTASTIAAILAADPRPITATHPAPPALDHLIRTCLAKDPDDRFQTAHDVKLQLLWIAQSGSGPIAGSATAHPASARLAWIVAGLLSLALIASGIAWWFQSHRTPAALYFSTPVPLIANGVALSPDGHNAAIVAYSRETNKYMLWRYEVGGRDAIAIPGTEGASHPFWAPDGKSLAFFGDGKLKKVDAFSGTAPQIVCEARTGRGGTWNRDGVILFAPDATTGLFRIPSVGGTPVEVTKLDLSRGQSSNRWPVFLPDHKHFLYLGANFSGQYENNAVFVGSLDSGETHMIVSASSNAAYAEPGYLLYIRNNALVAQRFDLKTLSVTGEPATISDEVRYTPATDQAVFSVAKDVLAIQTGKGIGTSQLVWFDRSGKELGFAGPAGIISNATISPDARRIAYDQMDPDSRHWAVWTRDLLTDATARITFGAGLTQLPVWSPDGKQLAYASIRNSMWTIFVKNADGSGSETPVGDNAPYVKGPWSWANDGKLLFWNKSELWYAPMPDPKPKPVFVEKPTILNAQFSPDGRWLAYSSNEGGSFEIYVSAFPHTESKWQISRDGGGEPRWRRDGKELFYLSADGKVISVSVKAATTFEAGPPQALFQTHLRQSISALDHISYDVSADGQKFLVDTKTDESNATPMSVVLNWSSNLEK
jgi:serine/threonine protein kinase/Tol biopolymer transport system component